MVNKSILVTLADGSKWETDAHYIAENRALYYSEKETDEDSEALVYKEEYEFTFNDDDELVDWFYNNMNMKDLYWYKVTEKEELTPINSDHIDNEIIIRE